MGWLRSDGSLKPLSTPNQTPPCARDVKIITGTFPGTVAKRNRASGVATMITASCKTKLAPIPMRGPSPNDDR